MCRKQKHQLSRPVLSTQNLQFNERISSFEGAVLDGRDLISSEIDFEQVRQVPEEAVRLDPNDLIVIQNPINMSIR